MCRREGIVCVQGAGAVLGCVSVLGGRNCAQREGGIVCMCREGGRVCVGVPRDGTAGEHVCAVKVEWSVCVCTGREVTV